MNKSKRTSMLHKSADKALPKIPPDMTRASGSAPKQDRLPVLFCITWLDEVTVGGIAEGENLLFLAPSGGATTAFATQVAWSQAQGSYHTIFFSFDERRERIAARFQAMITGVPRIEFETTSIGEMSESIQAKFQQARVAFGRFIHPFNMTTKEQGEGGVQELAGAIDAQVRAGCRPAVVVVDGLDWAVGREMTRMGSSASQTGACMAHFAEQFRDLCRARGIRGVVTHYFKPPTRWRPYAKPDHTMAVGCKSLGSRFDHILVLGRLSPDGYGTIIRTKGCSTSDFGSEVVLRLNDGLSRFEGSGDVVFDRRNGEYVLKDPLGLSD